jgi:hypothetical protein
LDSKLLNPSLPGTLQPTARTFTWYTRFPGGLPGDLYVAASPKGKGISVYMASCALLDPPVGPTFKLGGTLTVDVEPERVTFRAPRLRVGLVVAGTYFHADFNLQDHSLSATTERFSYVNGHPVLHLEGQYRIWSPQAPWQPLGLTQTLQGALPGSYYAS